MIATGRLLASELRCRWSKIREWTEGLTVTFVEEAQQYGGVNEVVVVSRLMAQSLVVFGGDKCQTPGRLNKEAESSSINGRRRDRAPFCVAGAALGAPDAAFAGQVQHLESLGAGCGQRSPPGPRAFLRGRCSTRCTGCCLCVAVLRGRCSNRCTGCCFCVAGAALTWMIWVLLVPLLFKHMAAKCPLSLS